MAPHAVEMETRPITISTSDPAVNISKRFGGLHEFIERNPKLAPLADDLFHRLSEAVPELLLDKSGDSSKTQWRSLLYLRSSFSTDLHPLYVAHRAPKRVEPRAFTAWHPTFDKDPFYRTARQNWFSGLHPLPQVIDALYGRMEDTRRHMVRVDLDFTAVKLDNMSATLMQMPPLRQISPKYPELELEYKHVLLRIARNAKGFAHSTGSDRASVFPDLLFTKELPTPGRECDLASAPDEIYPCVRDFEIWSEHFSDNTPMNTALIAGASRLCAFMDVRANQMMYRAVMGGVFSLWRYGQPSLNPDAGDEYDVVTTLLCRPSNAAAVSAGVILFGRGPNPSTARPFNLLPDAGDHKIDYGPDRDESAIARISDILRAWTWEVEDVVRSGRRRQSWDLQSKTVLAGNDRDAIPLLGGGAFKSLHKLLDINPGQPNVRYGSSQVGEAIADSAGMRLRGENRRGLGHAICRLLERAILLSDTQDEGRPVSFGLMLGDPFNVRYWPGARPSPIVEPLGPNQEQHSLSIDRLRSRIEYVSGPQLRCIVFPYFAVYPRGGKGDNNPSYVIDLAEFGPSIASWPPSTLWSRESSIYAYLSAQCPGTIACLVGPGAHVRVFANGNMVAYRNSREWFVLQNITSNIPDRSEDNTLRQVAEQLLQLGAAMSPFHNPERHGGFIVWTREREYKRRPEHHRDDPNNPPAAVLEKLHVGEPERLFGQYPWLSGRELLKWVCKGPIERNSGSSADSNGDTQSGHAHTRPNYDRRLAINFPVAQQVLKASERDGAVWLTGERCRFEAFGMRVNLDSHGEGEGANIGTKRRTAEDLVKEGRGETLAVTVSSDGPIRLWYLPEGSHDVVPADMFTAIETNERDYH